LERTSAECPPKRAGTCTGLQVGAGGEGAGDSGLPSEAQVGVAVPPLRPPPDLIKDEEEYEVDQILDSRKHGRGSALQYLV
jgi:hypothetical protein